ncbi:MAG: hypothetical protein H7330_02340 [Hymenobacteraceae bacterium]|nr:hypothetical protein [Hymenobacteraceae bacterium]
MTFNRRRALRGVLRWHGPLLALGWALNNLRWARIFGLPHLVADSRARYLPYAHDIAERGYFAAGHNLRYVGYPLWLSGWLRAGAGPAGAAWGQLAVAGLAGVAFYSALYHLTRRRTAAILGTAALVLWPDAQEFNGFILTESLAASGLVLTFAALVRARTTPRPLAAWTLALGAALLTASLRPNAFVVPLGLLLAGITALAARYGAAPVRRGLLAATILLVPAGWWLLNKLLLTFTLIETYTRGELIYGYAASAIHPTKPLWLPPADWAPALRLATFATHNPVFFLRLVAGKLGLFFAYARTYHSWGHIVLIGLVIWPLYWLAWRGTRAHSVWHPARIFLTTVVLGQAAIVGLTVEDWDGRFLIAVLPAVFALAAMGWAARQRPIEAR